MKRLLIALFLVVSTSLATGAPTPVPPKSPPTSTPTPAPKPTPKPAPAKPVPAKPATPKPVPAKPEVPPPVVKKEPPNPAYFLPGGLAVSGGLGTSFGALSLTSFVGAEYTVGGFKVLGLPFTWGVIGQADLGWFTLATSDYGVTDLGVGVSALGVVHFPWRSLVPGVAVVNQLDSSLKLGFGYYSVGRSFSYSGDVENGGTLAGVGVYSSLTTSWFVLERLAVNLDFGFSGYYTALGLGVTYRF